MSFQKVILSYSLIKKYICYFILKDIIFEIKSLHLKIV